VRRNTALDYYRRNRRLESWYSSPEAKVIAWRQNKSEAALFQAPPYFDVVRAVESSRQLLDQPADWDEVGNTPLDEATWCRATTFLLRHAQRLYDRHGICLPAPHVGLGPDGSIDFHWKTDRRELLLNIPASGGNATFYGDSLGGNNIKGQVDPATLDLGLFTWLTIID
jgi:hypothetical protein